MNKHTPGPWFAAGRIVNSENLFKLAVTEGHGQMEAEANAHLIAAAPELLNAVRFVLEYHADKQNEQTLEVLRKAIAKARGGVSADGL